MGGVKFINYVGPKYGKKKNAYFEQTDIFVFPTYYSNECFPLVLLEAMQYKLPIVTTNEGGIPDIVKDGVNGCTCERMDSLSLANEIETIISDRNVRIELGENGYKMFKEEFTLARFNISIANILKIIANR